jgi:phosphoglycolate phosphatase-like HAD superfamily hydrolase
MGSRPDAVVFDVDGVLIDTEGSYVEAVARTVHWLLVHDAGLRDDGPPFDRAMVHLWKRTAGWNDDWDLAYAMYRWLIAAEGSTTTARRRSAEAAEQAAQRGLPELERASDARRALGWDEVRGVFEEIYNGTAVAVERYGVTPRVHRDHGLAESERILLEDGVLAELASIGIDKVGIVTGRSRLDWEQVAARLPLPPSVAVATMEDGRKPEPTPLGKVVRALRPRSVVAVGDTRADLEMVRRWNATDDGARVPAHAVLVCPEEDEPDYRAAGGSLFIRELSDLPRILGTIP